MIGILYESDEWSDHKLARELEALGREVKMIDLARSLVDGREVDDGALMEAAASCTLLVSRVFASAAFRGHGVAHERMERVCGLAAERGIEMINPPAAHAFETSKLAAVRALADAGLDVPGVQACGLPGEIDPGGLTYPCIVKPDCGGRTTYTLLARGEGEVRGFLPSAPEIAFILEDYIEPERGFITRVELVDGRCSLIVKRSVVAGGLSAYHLGSEYELYPECAQWIRSAAERAGEVLSIAFGSFDIIENGGSAYVIDANSVSNVSEDNTETFGGYDLMREYAVAIARGHGG